MVRVVIGVDNLRSGKVACGGARQVLTLAGIRESSCTRVGPITQPERKRVLGAVPPGHGLIARCRSDALHGRGCRSNLPRDNVSAPSRLLHGAQPERSDVARTGGRNMVAKLGSLVPDLLSDRMGAGSQALSIRVPLRNPGFDPVEWAGTTVG